MVRALPLVLAATVAFAGDDTVRSETIALGQVIERDVGHAIGVVCDDDVVVASIETRNERNFVTFRGNREGTTTCRVGTDPTRVSYLFSITVKRVPERS